MGNNLKIELEGKYILVSKKILKPEYHDNEKRVFFCEDGFGCSPNTVGNAIFGYYVFDNEKCRIEGYQVERLATEEEIKKAKELKNEIN